MAENSPGPGQDGGDGATGPHPTGDVRDPRSYRADGAYDGEKSEGEGDERKDGAGEKGGKSGDRGDGKKPGPFQRPAVLIGGAVLLVVLILALILSWLHNRRFQSTDDAYVDTRIVHIAPQIAGRVYQITANDNQYVGPGQVLVRIDPVDVDARVRQAQAQRGASGTT